MIGSALFLVSVFSTAYSSVLTSREAGMVCRRERREVFLPNDIPQTLESPGYSEGLFLEDCTQTYDLFVERPNDDLSQWRIKLEIASLDLDCASGYLQIEEDGEVRRNLKICNEERPDSDGFYYSHAHALSVKVVTEECSRPEGCQGQGVRLRVSGQYVCGGQYGGEEGYFTSPLYPHNYLNSIACIYDIVAPRGNKLNITCTDFRLSMRGADKTMLQNIETSTPAYTGTDLKGKSFKSKRNVVTLYFLSNNIDLSDQKPGYGFNCTFRRTS